MFRRVNELEGFPPIHRVLRHGAQGEDRVQGDPNESGPGKLLRGLLVSSKSLFTELSSQVRPIFSLAFFGSPCALGGPPVFDA